MHTDYMLINLTKIELTTKSKQFSLLTIPEVVIVHV